MAVSALMVAAIRVVRLKVWCVVAAVPSGVADMGSGFCEVGEIAAAVGQRRQSHLRGLG